MSDTNTVRKSRRELIALLKSLGYRVEVVLFDVGRMTCLGRNQGRNRQVPPAVIATMARRIRENPPSLEEGMDAIRVVSQEGAERLLAPETLRTILADFAR